MSATNLGAITLERARVARNLNNAALAKLLGIDAPLASRLRSGNRKPSLAIAVRCRDEFGIDPAAWNQDAPAAEAKPKRKRAA